MDLITLYKNADANLVVFLLTSFIAFISWIVKSLIEKPLSDSKGTFSKYFERRIEILTEIKTRLNFIAYFPEGDDNLEYKNQLQNVLLNNEKAAYLSKEVYDNVLRISIDKKTDEKLLLETIQKIDDELYKKIKKVQEEIHFYRMFSNYNPIRRFIGISYLSIQYLTSLILILAIIFGIIHTLLIDNNYLKIGLILFIGFLLILVDKWLKYE